MSKFQEASSILKVGFSCQIDLILLHKVANNRFIVDTDVCDDFQNIVVSFSLAVSNLNYQNAYISISDNFLPNESIPKHLVTPSKCICSLWIALKYVIVLLAP